MEALGRDIIEIAMPAISWFGFIGESGYGWLYRRNE